MKESGLLNVTKQETEFIKKLIDDAVEKMFSNKEMGIVEKLKYIEDTSLIVAKLKLQAGETS